MHYNLLVVYKRENNCFCIQILVVMQLFILLQCLFWIKVYGDFNVRFENAKYFVEEGASVDIKIIAEGVPAGDVTIIVEIIGNNPKSQFQNGQTNWPILFKPGSNPITSATIKVTALDDLEPELGQLFNVSILTTTIGLVSKIGNDALIEIMANDDYGGIFEIYQNNEPVRLYETQTNSMKSIVNVTILRSKGSLTTEVIVAEIYSTAAVASEAEKEFTPYKRTISFEPGVLEISELFQVIDDEIAELDEIFFISLRVQEGKGRIDPNKNNKTIIISASDTPIRFAKDEIRVDEIPKGNQTVSVTVWRGLDKTGTIKLGPTNFEESVKFLVKGTSTLDNRDFIVDDSKLSRTLKFLPDYTQQTLSITILDDDIPESDEEIELSLSLLAGSQSTLADPIKCRIVIVGNDDQNGIISLVGLEQPHILIDEDTDKTVQKVKVIRTRGKFGTIKVQWWLTLMQGSTLGLSPESGFVILQNDQKEAIVEFSVLNDYVPSGRRLIEMKLSSVDGGAVLGFPNTVSMIIKDSDNAHGHIVLQDSPLSGLVEINNQRALRIIIARDGALIGDVSVELTIKYSMESSISEILTDTNSEPQVVWIRNNSSFTVIQKKIRDEFFLELNSIFTVEIHNVTADFPHFNTPTIVSGSSRILIFVTNKFSDSIVSINSPPSTELIEPMADIPTLVSIRASRTGVWRSLVIPWKIKALNADMKQTDVSPFNEMVRFDKGVSNAEITLQILPDKLPEIDESFQLYLLQVSSTYRVDASNALINFTIVENDAPAGEFQFSGVDFIGAPPNLTLLEGQSNPTKIHIIRTGSSISPRDIVVTSVPDDGKQFYGLPQTMTFGIGEMHKTIDILPRDDDVPEDTEVFMIILSDSTTNKYPAKIKDNSRIFVTIPKNDNPSGVVEFDSIQTHSIINESKETKIGLATFKVNRKRGSFYPITVKYRVEPVSQSNSRDDPNDFTVMSGVIRMKKGVDVAYLVLISVADEIPERNETFNVTLFDPSNGAKLGDVLSVFVTILQNDNPILFKEPNNMRTTEGSLLTLTLFRDWDVGQPALVNVKTQELSAKANTDFVPISKGIDFQPNENTKQVSIQILDNDEPEPDKEFLVLLEDTVGDVSVYYNKSLRVIISANDGAGGVIRFGTADRVTLIEGILAEIRLIREISNFTKVDVSWRIKDDSMKSQFETAQGIATFDADSFMASISLKALNDTIPEIDMEGFVELINVEAGTESKLGSITLKPFKIQKNDDANGNIAIELDTNANLVMSEEDDPLYPNRTVIKLVRKAGTFGDVKFKWELLKDSLCIVSRFIDPIFISTHFAKVNRHVREHSIEYHFLPKQQITVTSSAMVHNSVYLTSKFNLLFCFNPASVQFKLEVSSTPGLVYFQLTYRCDDSSCKLDLQRIGSSIMPTLEAAVPTKTSTICFYVSLDDRLLHVNVDFNNTSHDRTINGPGFMLPEKYEIHMENLDTENTLVISKAYIFNDKLSEKQQYEIMVNSRSTPDWKATNGIVEWQNGQTAPRSPVSIETVNDDIPEPDSNFCLFLTSSHLARASEFPIYKVLLIRSDYGNGLFGFKDDACTQEASNPTDPESFRYICIVERTRGFHGDMTNVSWSVQTITGIHPELQFMNTAGVLVFRENDREKKLELVLLNDWVPELFSSVKIVLTQVNTSYNGSLVFLDTSSAGINASSDSISLNLPANDYPHGLLQIWSHPPNLDPDMKPYTYVRMKNHSEEIYVNDKVGSVTVYLVRTQGLFGRVYGEWRTNDGSATSSGQARDYKPDGNLVEFPASSLSSVFVPLTVTILEHTFPEDNEYFEVQTLNPRDGAQVGPASILKVIITNSSDAYGVFGFGEGSLINQTYSEEPGVKIKFKIYRKFGLLRSVKLDWSISPIDQSNDQSIQSDIDITNHGSVLFAVDQSETNIEIEIIDDVYPELEETFQIKLLGANLGRISPLEDTVYFSVLPNDDPYGIVQIDESSKRLNCNESNKDIFIGISRTGGLFGDIRIYYRTEMLSSSEFGIAQERDDFQVENKFLDMKAGEKVSKDQCKVRIINDDVPELMEVFIVRIYRVELIRNSSTLTYLANSPKLGKETVSLVVISENDNPRGIISMAQPVVRVHENQTDNFLLVNRTGGLYGQVVLICFS